MDINHSAIEKAVSTMWERYDEPLTLDDIADSAILSKFYFSRVFRALTGTSPGRFLAAIRLSKAKDLLLETQLSVTDITYRVGYNSLGTFTSRFTKSVGVSPARYRTMSFNGQHAMPYFRIRTGADGTGSVGGTIRLPDWARPLRVYVGAFSSPVVEGRPVSCDLLGHAGSYALHGMPAGAWYIRAVGVLPEESDQSPWSRCPSYVGSSGSVVVRQGRRTEAHFAMRAWLPLDLPILMALPELDNCWSQPELARAA